MTPNEKPPEVSLQSLSARDSTDARTRLARAWQFTKLLPTLRLELDERQR